MESLDKLKDAVRGAIQRDFDAQSRRKVKKELLDALDAKYSFELPPTPGRAGVRRRLGAGRGGHEDATARPSPTRTRPRRRPGPTTARSPSAACGSAWSLRRSARRPISRSPTTRSPRPSSSGSASIPGQEKQVWEFYQKNPQALAEIRAPLFEEKVVDHILSPGEGGRRDRSPRRRSSATTRPTRRRVEPKAQGRQEAGKSE